MIIKVIPQPFMVFLAGITVTNEHHPNRTEFWVGKDPINWIKTAGFVQYLVSTGRESGT
jgi:hypothetical protein